MNQNGRLLSLLKQTEKLGIPGFDCVVQQHGKSVFRYLSGFSDYEKRSPVNGEELYNIYSASKIVTCTAALQLWEKKAFQLDDPLFLYLPEFREMTRRAGDHLERVTHPITIRQLFSMSAGFTYDLDSPSLREARTTLGDAMPTREVMKFLAREPLDFEPGERWQYSLCHDVIAALVEALSGMRFSLYVGKHIFEPLGMTRSYYHIPDAMLSQVAAQYRYDEKLQRFENCGKKISSHCLGAEYDSGGAGIITCVSDYCRFLNALCAGEALLRRDTVAMMMTPQLTQEQLKNYWCPTYSYGLGVRCPLPGGTTKDFGWGGAAGVSLAVLPEMDAIYFFAQHVLESPNAEQRDQMAQAVTDDLL